MRTADLSIPPDWDQVTPEWMTAVLARHHPGAEVADVAVLLRDNGTNRRARLGLTYSAGTGPTTVFGKAAEPAHAELNARTGGTLHEPRLFSSDVALPVDHPLVYLALVDETAVDYVMIMEDLTARGADPRDATRPMSVEQAASGLRGLARLHSHHWDKVAQEPALSWVEPFLPWVGMGRRIPTALERLGDTIPAEVRELSVERLVDDVWTRFIRTLTVGPMTLLHGDAHVGNTYVLPDGEVGFLDWQVVRTGGWSLDVGYFLQGALTTEDRRRGEDDLLQEYRSHLDLPADQLPSAEEVRLRYRASVAHGLTIWLATLSHDGWQRTEVSEALCRRYAEAYVDLETTSALEAVERL